MLPEEMRNGVREGREKGKDPRKEVIKAKY